MCRRVATRAIRITTVRMGCSVSHRYGRRRNSPRPRITLYESRFEEVQNMTDFKGQCGHRCLWPAGVAHSGRKRTTPE